ncbi:MAG: prolyl oligopeptidase family serine peptidase [Bacteroidales bacterium]
MNFNSTNIFLLFSLLFSSYSCSLRTPDYPYAENNVTRNNYFGTVVNDTYQWLEPDSGVIRNKWLSAQKQFTGNQLQSLPSYRQIHNRIGQLSQTPDFSMLKIVNNKLFYLQRSILSRHNVLNVIDITTMENKLIKDPADIIGNEHFSTSNHAISGDGRYIAFITSLSENDNKIFIYDINNDILLSDIINQVNHTPVAWDHNGIYYSKSNDLSAENTDAISQNIYYHKLGTPQSEDKIIYQNNIDIFSIFYPVTTDNETMLAIIENCSRSKGNSIYVKNLVTNGPVIKVTDDCEAKRIPVELNEKELYMIATDNAPKGKLVKVNLATPSRENWTDIIPEHNKHLTSVTPLDDRFIVTYQDNKNNEAWFSTKEGKKVRKLNIPQYGLSEFYSNKYQDKVFFTYTSATCPKILLEVKKDVATPLILRFPADMEFDPREYISEVIKVPSSRGDSLPVNLTYKKGIKKDGTTPTVLFNHTEMSAAFSSQFFFTRIFYLEQGYIFAETLEDAEFMINPNASKPAFKIKEEIDDLITIAHYLTDKKITSRERLCIAGREKGATIVMSAAVKDPSIANVISVSRGAYDLVRLPVVDQTWDWIKYFGSADSQKEMFDYIYSYSPVHNIKDGTEYPAMFIMTEEGDKYVSPSHSYKLAATLQRSSKGNSPILLHISPSTTVNNHIDFRVYTEAFADQAAFVMKYTDTPFKEYGKR